MSPFCAPRWGEARLNCDPVPASVSLAATSHDRSRRRFAETLPVGSPEADMPPETARKLSCNGRHSRLVLKLRHQPSSCHAPVTFHGPVRNVQGSGRFINCHTSKVTELNNFRVSRIHLRQSIQSIIQFDQVDEILIGIREHATVKCESPCAATALDSSSLTGMIDKDPTHSLADEYSKVRPSPSVWSRIIRHPEPCLVDKIRRLQRVSNAFTGKEQSSNLLQVPVGPENQRFVNILAC